MHFWCILYSLLPFVDTLNGFLIKEMNSNLSVGQFYRFLLITAICMVMISYKRVNQRDFELLMGIISIMIILSLIHAQMGRNVSAELTNTLSWILFPCYIFGFSLLDAHGKMYEEDRKKIFEIWLWAFPLTILIPKLIGVGYSTYGGGIGYKAFYYANNGVSFALSILVIYSLNKFGSDLSVKSGIQFGLCAWACLTIGTKSCMFSIIVAVIFLLFDKLSRKQWNRLLIVGVALLLAYLFFGNFIQGKITAVIERYNYFSRLLNNVFIDSITTGRTGKMDNLWIKMKNEGVIRYILGLGYNNYVVEMDFFDLFFQYGIIGVIAYVWYIFSIKKNTFKDAGIYRKLGAFSMLYALTVGHVFNNAMSTMVFALIFYSFSLKDESERGSAQEAKYNKD